MNEQVAANPLGTERVGKLMIRYAIPSIISIVVNSLYNMVDQIFIGQGVGYLGNAATNIILPLTSILLALGMMIGDGTASYMSLNLGKGRSQAAAYGVGNAVTLTVGVSVFLLVLFELFLEPLCHLFGATEGNLPYALEYGSIIVLGFPFAMIDGAFGSIIRADGRPKVSMVGLLIGCITNIILDPIFIYALHMGVRGAALATVISQAISGIWVVRFLAGKQSKLRLRRSRLRPRWSIMTPVLALGVSPFIMQSTEALLNISFNASLQRYGGDVAVAAMTVASTVMQIVWIPTQGLGQGAQPIISYNYGARNPDRVRAAFKALLGVSMTVMLTFWALVQLFPQFFIRIFNSDPELLETAVWTLRVYTAVVGLFGIQMAVQQTFTAIGKAKAALFIACLRKVILLIPLIFILPHFFENKVFAVFLAEPVSDFISVTAAAITFYFVFRPAMKELEAPQEKEI